MKQRFLAAETVKEEEVLDLLAALWSAVKRGKLAANKLEEELNKVVKRCNL